MTFEEELAKPENEYIKIIGNYLAERAKSDPSVARNIEKEHKSLKRCFQYIVDEAKKQKQGSCAMVKDDAVFGWAVHYYDEDDLKIDKVTKRNPVKEAAKAVKDVVKKEAVEPVEVKDVSDDEGQLSLF